ASLLDGALLRSLLEGSADRARADHRLAGHRDRDRLLRRARRAQHAASDSLAGLGLQLALPRDADTAPALLRLVRATADLGRVRRSLVHAVRRCLACPLAERGR